MKLIFLGTGTSYGIPMIGCQCDVCTSDDPRNKRLRPAVYVETADVHLVIDTPPDFRSQVLIHGVKQVDAVLITHAHADHIFGFDDLRCFYEILGKPIPVYGPPADIAHINEIFAYVDAEIPPGASVLRVDFKKVNAGFDIRKLHVEPLPVFHGANKIYGYLLEAEGKTLGYAPDCSRMPEEVMEQLKGIDVMVLDALRRTPHPTHFTLSESLDVLRKIGARSSYITHLAHDLDHESTQKGLPASVNVAYDGLTLEW